MTQNNLLSGPYWYRHPAMRVNWAFYYLYNSRSLFWTNSRGSTDPYNPQGYYPEIVDDGYLFKAPLLLAKLLCPQVFTKSDDIVNTRKTKQE